MKVKELIKKLEEFDPEMVIGFSDYQEDDSDGDGVVKNIDGVENLGESEGIPSEIVVIFRR